MPPKTGSWLEKKITPSNNHHSSNKKLFFRRKQCFVSGRIFSLRKCRGFHIQWSMCMISLFLVNFSKVVLKLIFHKAIIVLYMLQKSGRDIFSVIFLSFQFLLLQELLASILEAILYLKCSAILDIWSYRVGLKNQSAHALSWPLIEATSSLHQDLMAYVGQGRMHGNSIPPKARPKILIVRMASESTNVWLSSLLVSSPLEK